MITEDMKPLVFALADAIETDIATGAQGAHSFAGSRKAVLELFEGYSPTILSGIDNSLYDPGNSVAAVDQHIFGNVGAITVVETLELEEFKTRAIAAVLEKLGLGESSVLIVLAEQNEKVEISARNLANVHVIRAEGLNVYDLLRHSKLLLTQAAVGALGRRLTGASEVAS